jgi:flagellin
MALTIGSNLLSLRAMRSLTSVSDNLSRVTERLSSGMRMNRASDDAAGLAITSTLDMRSRVYGVGIRNGNDAISALNIADGTLGVMSSMLDRMTELATQASNGTFSTKQRASLDREAQALQQELVRLQGTTSFNGISLLANGSQDIGVQLGIGNKAQINVLFGISVSSTSTSVSGMGTGSLALMGVDQDHRYALADRTGDGLDDLYVVDGSGNLDLIINDEGSFGGTLILAYAPGTVAGMTAGDIDGDSVPDVVIAFTNGDIGQYTSTGGYQTQSSGYGSFNQYVNPVLVDLNGDQVLDWVVASGRSLVGFYNDGNGNIIGDTSDAISSGGNINTFDVAVDPNSGEFTVWASQAGGSFITSFSTSGGFLVASGTPSTGISVTSTADINGDGDRDFAIGKTTGIATYTGDGNQLASYTISGGAGYVASGDFNGDGRPDVASSINGTVTFLLGAGAASFTLSSQRTVAGASNLVLPQITDLNGDGKDDFLAWNGQFTGGLYSIMWQSSSTSSAGLALDPFSLTTISNAQSALDTLATGRARISSTRGLIGASMGRISVAISNLYASRLGSETASARIKTADVATETANYTRLQILQKTAAAVLAQANQAPSLVVQLLANA